MRLGGSFGSTRSLKDGPAGAFPPRRRPPAHAHTPALHPAKGIASLVYLGLKFFPTPPPRVRTRPIPRLEIIMGGAELESGLAWGGAISGSPVELLQALLPAAAQLGCQRRARSTPRPPAQQHGYDW